MSESIVADWKYCDDHKMNQEHFRMLDDQVGELKEGQDELRTAYNEQRVLITKIDTLLDTMQKTHWILVTSIIGCIVMWAFSIFQR